MGAGQSNLYLYLGCKSGTFSFEGQYSVTVTKKFSQICNNFERVEYEINYNTDPKVGYVKFYRFYDISIYKGADFSNPGPNVFTYYCNRKIDVLKRVVVFYSILHPDDPLVVIFVTVYNKKHPCSFNELKKAGWDYSSNIDLYLIKHKLSIQLPSDFSTLSKSFKINFSTNSGHNKGVNKKVLNVGDGNIFKKLIYFPVSSGSTVVNSELFNSIGSKGVPNQIDSIYFFNLTLNKLDGIIVYYSASYSASSNTAIFVEFFYDCTSKYQFVRKDKNSTWWEKQKVEFKDDSSLAQVLEKFKLESEKFDVTTFILESKIGYNNVKVELKNKDAHVGYSYFSHSPTQFVSRSSNLLFKNSKIKAEKDGFNKQLINLTTYFLKKKDKNEDDTPFLIQFVVFKSIIPIFSKRFYYFYPKDLDKLLEWKQFEYTDNDLDVKLKEIGELILKKEKEKEEKEYKDLRKEVNDIIKRPPPPPKPPPKPPGDTTVPKKEEEEPPLTAPAIAGIAVGGLIGTATVGGSGYGLYLYFTTIYLLT